MDAPSIICGSARLEVFFIPFFSLFLFPQGLYFSADFYARVRYISRYAVCYFFDAMDPPENQDARSLTS